jgi:hypothetical protein
MEALQMQRWRRHQTPQLSELRTKAAILFLRELHDRPGNRIIETSIQRPKILDADGRIRRDSERGDRLAHIAVAAYHSARSQEACAKTYSVKTLRGLPFFLSPNGRMQQRCGAALSHSGNASTPDQSHGGT